MRHMVFTISGMSCEHCLSAVGKALAAVSGVKVESLRIGRVELGLPDAIETKQITAAIETIGYKVSAVTPA